MQNQMDPDKASVAESAHWGGSKQPQGQEPVSCVARYGVIKLSHFKLSPNGLQLFTAHLFLGAVDVACSLPYSPLRPQACFIFLRRSPITHPLI